MNFGPIYIDTCYLIFYVIKFQFYYIIFVFLIFCQKMKNIELKLIFDNPNDLTTNKLIYKTKMQFSQAY